MSPSGRRAVKVSRRLSPASYHCPPWELGLLLPLIAAVDGGSGVKALARGSTLGPRQMWQRKIWLWILASQTFRETSTGLEENVRPATSVAVTVTCHGGPWTPDSLSAW